jgi:hypothetical protein
MEKVTKKSIKERQDLVNSLTHKLTPVLRPFENKYMDAYTDWNIAKIQSVANKYPGLETFEDFQNEFMDKTWESKGFVNPNANSRFQSRHFNSNVITHDFCHRLYSNKKMAKKRLSTMSLLSYGFMKEAAEGYATKFARLVEKCADAKMSGYRLQVVEVADLGHELEFLIQDEYTEQEIHARAIFVNGAIKAPHYRFITTTRALKV